MQRDEILNGKNVISKPCILSVGYIPTNRKLIKMEIGGEALVFRLTRRVQDIEDKRKVGVNVIFEELQDLYLEKSGIDEFNIIH